MYDFLNISNTSRIFKKKKNILNKLMIELQIAIFMIAKKFSQKPRSLLFF